MHIRTRGKTSKQSLQSQQADTSTATAMLETNCPKCGRAMRLRALPGLDPEDIARLAGLVLCDLCADWYAEPPQPQPPAVRSPMADP
jgi:hypothetical protein